MTDEKIEPLTETPLHIARRLVQELLAGCGDNSCRFKKPSGMATNGGCRCYEKIEATIDAGRSARLKAEKQRDCAHRETSYGICVDCDFDYRTYDPDDSKCPTHGEWRDTKLVCPRCAKDALTVERGADGQPVREEE